MNKFWFMFDFSDRVVSKLSQNVYFRQTFF